MGLSVLAIQAFAVDPCEMTTPYSGGTRVPGNGIKDIGNGFNYELWNDQNSPGLMTVYGGDADCAFKANWNNSGDFLARVGYYWGGGNSPRPSEVDDIHAEYAYKRTGTGGGYSYIGVYGWTKSPTEVEYYIVDDSFNGMGDPWNTQYVGSFETDGATYKVYKGTRTNAPSISGTSTFTQVFSVRSSARQCGHISVSEHFKAWERMGIKLGQLYDCKLLCEAGGGSGSIDYTYATMYQGEPEPEAPAEPLTPYGDKAAVIPGKIEAENYDNGGKNNAYKDTDTKNEGEEYRQDGVDIVGVNGGYAIGYTTTSEWLKYTVNVEESGYYNVEALAANGGNKIGLELYLDDQLLCALTGNKTEDWDTYEKVTASKAHYLLAGEHVLQLKYTTDYNNVDYIRFYPQGEEPGDNPDVPGTIPGTIPDPEDPVAAGNMFDENGAYYGPSCEDNGNLGTGAYYTGNYTSPFETVLGKSQSDIQKKLDQLWSHYFENGSNKVYYDRGNGEAYILDTGNNDVRSEGMSYGMMICVQTDHKAQFDKLWAFAKNHMWHKSGGNWDGYFAWQCGTDGSVKDQNCAPDGEMYFTMALLFAANRWNEESYMKDAQYILKSMWKGNSASLFNENYKVVTFQPVNCSDFSDPSYDLPAFVDLFSRWSTTNNNTWKQAASATRDHLYKSCNTSSGLFSDYNNFDGTPKSVNYNSNAHKYMYDAMRCAMNYGMDYYLFGTDGKRQTEMAKRIIDFFEKDGYSHARFNWDGSGAAETYTLGETGANAVACYALMNEPGYESKVKTNLNKAWNASLATGQYRYYDGLVHYLSMLHLCGSFKIWKPAPEVNVGTVEITSKEGVEIGGKVYTEPGTVYTFEDCQVYKLNLTKNISEEPDGPITGEEVVENQALTIYPNPAITMLNVVGAETVENVMLIDITGRVVLSTSETNINVSDLPAGTYAVRVKTADNVTVKKVSIVK